MKRRISFFGVDISGLDYTVLSENEYWCPNGDGEYNYIIQLNSNQTDGLKDLRNQMISQHARKLPIDSLLMHVKYNECLLGLPDYYYNDCEGLYLLRLIGGTDRRDFEILIYDESKHRLIVKCSIL